MSATDTILTLDNVSKHFGGLAVVENLSFSVRRGVCTGLIGPNGAGKTTVFNLITGVYPIDAGRIVLDGVDIAKIPSRRRIHHGVARNFQNIRLMPHLSALENVLVGQHCQNGGFFGVLQPVNLVPGNRWREEARAALEEAGLAAYERATVGSLPYGLQKRIELVRALMAKPRLCCSTSRRRDLTRPRPTRSASASPRSAATVASPCWWSSTTCISSARCVPK